MTRRLALAAAVMLLLGVVVGVLWATLWATPDGMAWKGRYYPVGEASREAMAGTGRYVLLCVGAGFVGAVVALLVAGRQALVAWAVGIAAAVLAGLLAAQVGLLLGPDDPQVVARSAPDGAPVASDLTLHGVSPYLAFPAGAALGFVAALVAGVGRESKPRGLSSR